MTWIGKTALTMAGIGFAGGGATLAGLSFMPPPKDTFSDYLNKQGRTVITGEESKWDTVKDKYNSEGDGLLITLKGNSITKGQLTSKELKEWCIENSRKEFTNLEDVTYQRVSAWCTTPTTIEKLVGKSKTPLNDDEPVHPNKNTNETEWGEKKLAYKTTQKKELINNIVENNSEGAEITNASEITEIQLRKWCKFSKGKHFKHEKDSRYLKYLKWCVN